MFSLFLVIAAIISLTLILFLFTISNCIKICFDVDTNLTRCLKLLMFVIILWLTSLFLIQIQYIVLFGTIKDLFHAITLNMMIQLVSIYDLFHFNLISKRITFKNIFFKFFHFALAFNLYFIMEININNYFNERNLIDVMCVYFAIFNFVNFVYYWFRYIIGSVRYFNKNKIMYFIQILTTLALLQYTTFSSTFIFFVASLLVRFT
jgi:hypothetical protein